MKIINEILELKTATTLDFIDITEKIQKKIKKSGIKNGVINIQSLHTTMSIIVNEAEPLLISDMKKLLEKLAPRTMKYMHDNFEIRTVNMCDGECANGHSHNKAIHLPTSTMLNIVKSSLQLGTWQRIFAIELDRSRSRKVALQIIGN
ncbi:MAG: secondary thiamine-phosphate synthase enzyme [Candidatus Moranbacteria bacterium CG_4_8_14_3_um_filter_34_16]|nr:MAG: secondary thiamine-phosphate synthase enzyme [Candidatus Moranbacteria bacterium CG08_land_8_20_14_0_20_34_16]PIW95270.1 MAG: secondary thiamine-phosphate synthase enzyme [Candidatus Moranbacteria bacterium CG_4_8_14_3_um_filter_34_16]